MKYFLVLMMLCVGSMSAMDYTGCYMLKESIRGKALHDLRHYHVFNGAAQREARIQQKQQEAEDNTGTKRKREESEPLSRNVRSKCE